MRLFVSSLSGGELQPESPFPIADDGYLYVMAWGQSNMLGSNPIDDGEPKGGDMSDLVNVYTPDLLGGWQQARYFQQPFNTVNHSNNIAAVFCRDLAAKYDLKIKLTFFAGGGAPLEKFLKKDACGIGYPTVDGQIYQWMIDAYATFDPADVRPASLVIFHQFESGTGMDAGAGTWPEVAEIVQQGYIDEGWALAESQIICGEIAGGSNLSRGPHNFTDEDLTNRRCAQSAGLQQAETVHFLGEGYDNFGKRYLKMYEELIFGYTSRPVDYTVRSPEQPVFSVSDITSTDFLATWTAVSSPYGLDIVQYKVQGINGFIDRIFVDGNTLSVRVPFSGIVNDTPQYHWTEYPTELFTVLAQDSEGKWSETDYDLQQTVTPL